MAAQELIDEIKRLIDDTLASVHTAMPGVISGASGMVASVKPSVTYKTSDGKSMAYPSIAGCPIVMPMSADGSIGVAFPVKAGDACMIVCCESTLSQWQSGNYQSGLRFGLSNAICVPCLLKSTPAAVEKARSKQAAILFSKKGEVLCGEDEITATYKDDYSISIKEKLITAKVGDDIKLQLDDKSIDGSVKTSTKFHLEDKKIELQAGDEEHAIVINESSSTMTHGADAVVRIDDSSATVQLDQDKRVSVSSSSAGVYFSAAHYIEATADKVHVEGDLDVSGTVTQGG